jgi:hypothetical protein
MKRALLVGAVAIVLGMFVAATPAAAQMAVREGTCTHTHGTNVVTYDCNFNVRDYTVGTPVKFTINYECSGACGPVTSFGLRDAGFTPEGVMGRMVGAKRLTNAIELTFVFDRLKTAGKNMIGNAHFNMNLSADDGTGTFVTVPCYVDVHLKQ